MSFLGSILGASWSFNKGVKDAKKEFNDMFGGDEQQQPVYLDDEPDVQYCKEEHQSWTAKRAAAAKDKGMKNIKSDAVRQAMERRAAAQAAAAKSKR